MNLTLQDLVAILVPMVTLVGSTWYHSNNRIDKLEGNLNKKIDNVESNLNKRIDKLEEKIDNVGSDLNKKIDNVEGKLGEKIDAVRDRVSRIEGQLIPTKVISFEEIRPREATEQKSARK